MATIIHNKALIILFYLLNFILCSYEIKELAWFGLCGCHSSRHISVGLELSFRHSISSTEFQVKAAGFQKIFSNMARAADGVMTS